MVKIFEITMYHKSVGAEAPSYEIQPMKFTGDHYQSFGKGKGQIQGNCLAEVVCNWEPSKVLTSHRWVKASEGKSSSYTNRGTQVQTPVLV